MWFSGLLLRKVVRQLACCPDMGGEASPGHLPGCCPFMDNRGVFRSLINDASYLRGMGVVQACRGKLLGLYEGGQRTTVLQPLLQSNNQPSPWARQSGDGNISTDVLQEQGLILAIPHEWAVFYLLTMREAEPIGMPKCFLAPQCCESI
jgi:hypothetical protein